MGLGERKNGHAGRECGFPQPSSLSVILTWQEGILILKVVFESEPHP